MLLLTTPIANARRLVVGYLNKPLSNSPAFDLANFHSFIARTYENPSKIDATYFVLGYTPTNDGFSQGFTVEKIFLKHIWEIPALPASSYC
ncbi:NgoBV family restriction endonuclease [Trueperella sp. LYQ143]|uniref:NgoBV family restriction endonuclease n=1 Tax=unclassified Trueperella TaxID=2630174 RepID=UPI003983B51A